MSDYLRILFWVSRFSGLHGLAGLVHIWAAGKIGYITNLVAYL